MTGSADRGFVLGFGPDSGSGLGSDCDCFGFDPEDDFDPGSGFVLGSGCGQCFGSGSGRDSPYADWSQRHAADYYY